VLDKLPSDVRKAGGVARTASIKSNSRNYG